jgi:glycosyltransferase involved in cell wall biosynthesis
MTTPFFTVLLPTKNRSGMLPYAVRSLLDQTFRDFEVIVVDNDDTTATAEMVYIGLAPLIDGRFRYLRTGGLWMSDNWEAALPLVRGEYVFVMEDKAVLNPRAFELLSQAIAFYSPRCLVFSYAYYPAPPMLAAVDAAAVSSPSVARLPEGRPPVRQISSARILDSFLEDGWRLLLDDGPRTINSVCERSLIQQIQETSGRGRFFVPYAPDVTSNLLQLDLLDYVSRIDLDLVSFAGNPQLSLGLRLLTSLKAGFDALFQAGHANIAHFERMPLGYLATLHNLLYAEFLNLRDHAAQGRLRGRQLSTERYFDRIDQDLCDLAGRGEDVTGVQAMVKATRDRVGIGFL